MKDQFITKFKMHSEKYTRIPFLFCKKIAITYNLSSIEEHVKEIK